MYDLVLFGVPDEAGAAEERLASTCGSTGGDGGGNRTETGGAQGRGSAETKPPRVEGGGEGGEGAAGGVAGGSLESRPDSGAAAGGVGGVRIRSKREIKRELTGEMKTKRTRNGHKHKKKKN